MQIVGWQMTPTNSEEKDAFVRRIDEGMDRLRRHRSASGNGGDDGFGDGDGEIDADGDDDGRRAIVRTGVRHEVLLPQMFGVAPHQATVAICPRRHTQFRLRDGYSSARAEVDMTSLPRV